MRRQRKAANGDTDQAQGRQSDCRRHAPDLTVFSFGQGDGEPARGCLGALPNGWIAWPEPCWFFNVFRLAWAGDKIAKIDRAAQFFQRCCIWRSFHLNQISFRLLQVGMANVMLQPSIIRQQQQAFAVGIEPAGRIDIRNVQEIRQRLPLGMSRKLAHDIEGLIEKYERHGVLVLSDVSGARHDAGL